MKSKSVARFWKLINIINFHIHHVSFDYKFQSYGKIVVKSDTLNERYISYPRVFIGRNVGMNSGVKYNLIGGDNCIILRTVDNGEIHIGNGVGISNVAIVSMSRIDIEDNVLIGGSVKIYDNDFHSLDYKVRMNTPTESIVSKPIRICEGAFLGANSMILKGVTIGKHSIIGAGSVVTKDVPDNEIWAGNPARFIRKINIERGEDL